MTFPFLLLLSLGTFTITSIVPAICTWTFDLTISRFQTLRPEGVLVWVSGINNQFQGPDIIVSPGDRIIATVHNHLSKMELRFIGMVSVKVNQTTWMVYH